MQLNDQQREAVSFAKDGHSFLLTGGPGTGKTTSVCEIYSSLMSSENLLVCCTTGISCSVLRERSVPALTISRAFGLRDGRYSIDQLLSMFSGEDEYYRECRQRLQWCTVLVVDEISMVSSHTLLTMSTILQSVKGNSLPLGGVQRIFVGDFLQLPPIPNQFNGDAGEPLYRMESLQKYIPHKIQLTKVVRTSDMDLSSCVADLSHGIASDASLSFIRSLPATLAGPAEDHLVLYVRKFDAWAHNMASLNRLSGEAFSYRATDDGDRQALATLTVPETLVVKVGAPVMLLMNLSDELVNGLRGKVLSAGVESVTVRFKTVAHPVQISAQVFQSFSCFRKTATRKQIPLCVSYACTVTKSQSLTLDKVLVVCRNMAYPGLLPVALSRVKSVSGLAVSQFSTDCVVAPSAADLKLIRDIGSVQVDAEMSCCNRACESRGLLHYYAVVDTEPDEGLVWSDSDDDSFVETVSCSTDNQQLLLSLLHNEPTSEPEFTNNRRIHDLLNFSTIDCVINEFRAKINDNWCKLKNPENSSQLTAYMSRSHQQVAGLSETLLRNFPDVYHPILKRAYTALEKHLIHKKAGQKRNLTDTTSSTSSTASTAAASSTTDSPTDQSSTSVTQYSHAAGQGTIRRLAGRAVRQLMNMYDRKLRACVQSRSADLQEQYDLLQAYSAHASYMCTTVCTVLSGPYAPTANETERRQFQVGGGLLHVKDSVFTFFMELEKKRLVLHTPENAARLGVDVLAHCYNELMRDDALKGSFAAIFISMTNSQPPIIVQMYKDIVTKYIPVANNTFRLRLLRNFSKPQEQLSLRSSIKGASQSAKKKKGTPKP